MKNFLFILLFAVSHSWASHLENVCRNSEFNPLIMSEHYLSRQVDGKYVIETHDGNEIFSSHDSILSLIEEDKNLWLLTRSSVVKLSASGEVLTLHAIPHAKRMSVSSESIVLLDGRGEVISIHKELGHELWRSHFEALKGSKVVAVTFDGTNFLFVSTGIAQGGFNGIATVEPKTGKVIHQAQYNYYRAGVIHPISFSHWNEDHLIINNGGWIHKITGKQLKSKRAIMPKWIPFQIKAQGNVHAHFMMLRGDFSFSGKDLIGCGLTYEEGSVGDVQRVSSLFKVKI